MCTNQEHPTFICPAHNVTMFLDSYQFDITDINYTPTPIEYQCPFGCVFKIGVDTTVQQRKKENVMKKEKVMKTDIDAKIDWAALIILVDNHWHEFVEHCGGSEEEASITFEALKEKDEQ